MNYFTAQYAHSANDGNEYYTDATANNKNSLSSYGRFYEGHCIWDNLLERYNSGTSINMYSGHGTGGSGISSMYKNMAEQFPLAILIMKAYMILTGGIHGQDMEHMMISKQNQYVIE